MVVKRDNPLWVVHIKKNKKRNTFVLIQDCGLNGLKTAQRTVYSNKRQTEEKENLIKIFGSFLKEKILFFFAAC